MEMIILFCRRLQENNLGTNNLSLRERADLDLSHLWFSFPVRSFGFQLTGKQYETDEHGVQILLPLANLFYSQTIQGNV